MRKEKKEALQNIIDCFTGADGGGKFAILNASLDIIDKQAAKGDKPSQEIMEIMVKFSKLLNVLERI